MTADQVNPSERSVTDYLNALVWDGTPRLDRWLVAIAEAAGEALDFTAAAA